MPTAARRHTLKSSESKRDTASAARKQPSPSSPTPSPAVRGVQSDKKARRDR